MATTARARLRGAAAPPRPGRNSALGAIELLSATLATRIADCNLALAGLRTLLGVAGGHYALACAALAPLAILPALAMSVLEPAVAVGIADGVLACVTSGTLLGVTGSDNALT